MLKDTLIFFVRLSFIMSLVLLSSQTSSEHDDYCVTDPGSNKRLFNITDTTTTYPFAKKLILTCHNDASFSLFTIDNKHIHVNECNESSTRCSVCIDENSTDFEISSHDVLPSFDLEAFPKSDFNLYSRSLACSSTAAACLFAKPMLFVGVNDVYFTIDFTGRNRSIFELKTNRQDLSDELLSWDIQFHSALGSAPEIPSDFSGPLIVLGYADLEQVVLLGTHRVLQSSTCERSDEVPFGYASVFYAKNSSKGRGHILFHETARRLLDFRKRSLHHFSSINVGFVSSCFYLNEETKEISLPLSLVQDSFQITNRKSSSLVCRRLLIEMNGTCLATPLIKKVSRPSTPFTHSSKWTRLKAFFTPSEQILLIQNNPSFKFS